MSLPLLCMSLHVCSHVCPGVLLGQDRQAQLTCFLHFIEQVGTKK